MNPLKALLASMLLVAAAAIAGCGPGAGGTTVPTAVTPPPGETVPAEMTPAETSGLGY